jgi:MoxR-like ATPase
VVLSAERVVAIQGLVRRVPVPDHVFMYARDLVRATRPGTPEATEMVGSAVSWGAGPRAGQALILCAKAHALIQGRFAAGVADVRHVAPPVLRHRIVTTFRAEAEGIDPDAVVARLLKDVPAPTERGAAALAGSSRR